MGLFWSRGLFAGKACVVAAPRTGALYLCCGLCFPNQGPISKYLSNQQVSGHYNDTEGAAAW